jgi:hypothetical protein
MATSRIQLSILETLSIRLGYEDAGQFENVLDKITFGLSVDVYYLNIDNVWLHYVNDYRAGFYGYAEGSHLQITARLPLDRYRPNSILQELFR